MNTIKTLEIDSKYQTDPSVNKKHAHLEKLIEEIRKMNITGLDIDYINDLIVELNQFGGSEKELKKMLIKTKNLILKNLEKQHKIIPKNYHRNRWVGIGMLLYGVSFGVIFSTVLDNFAFVGVGLPIGMVLGMAIGANQDNKAKKEGRQLDIEAS